MNLRRVLLYILNDVLSRVGTGRGVDGRSTTEESASDSPCTVPASSPSACSVSRPSATRSSGCCGTSRSCTPHIPSPPTRSPSAEITPAARAVSSGRTPSGRSGATRTTARFLQATATSRSRRIRSRLLRPTTRRRRRSVRSRRVAEGKRT